MRETCRTGARLRASRATARFGSSRRRRVELRDRHVGLAESRVGDAAVVVDHGRVRGGLQGGVEVGDPAEDVAPRQFGQAAVVQGRGGAGAEPQGLVEVGDRAGDLAPPDEDLAAAGERLGERGVEPDRLAVGGDRVVQLAPAEMRLAPTPRRLRGRWAVAGCGHRLRPARARYPGGSRRRVGTSSATSRASTAGDGGSSAGAGTIGVMARVGLTISGTIHRARPRPSPVASGRGASAGGVTLATTGPAGSGATGRRATRLTDGLGRRRDDRLAGGRLGARGGQGRGQGRRVEGGQRGGGAVGPADAPASIGRARSPGGPGRP